MFKNYKWVIVFLLFLVYMINYLDRVALSITVPMIEKDLLLNAEQFGIVFGSFFFGYAIFNFVGGLAVDRFGPKLVLGTAVGLWSIFCGLTSIATGFASLLILRVLFGMAEGPICSSANKMINGWFPNKEAATAVGILSAGSPLGGVVAGPIVGYLALAFGWRPAFVIICAIGLVWMLIWFFFVADNRSVHAKKTGLGSTDDPNLSIASNPAVEDTKPVYGLLHYLKQPIILVTAFAFFCYNYILFFFLSWFPSYLVQAHGLNIKQMSLTTIIPWVVGFLGLALGGFVSDKILKITGRILFSRKLILVSCLLASAICVGLSGLVTNIVPAVALMSVSIFFLYVTGSIYWAIIQDVVHTSKVGSVSGFIHLIGSISGIIGPIITGFIVQHTGKFDSAFVLAGVIAAIGSLLVFLVIKDTKKDTVLVHAVQKF